MRYRLSGGATCASDPMWRGYSHDLLGIIVRQAHPYLQREAGCMFQTSQKAKSKAKKCGGSIAIAIALAEE